MSNSKNLYEIIKSNKFVISGPCVMESYEKCSEIAEFAKNICEKHGLTYIFKASFDKANRTSISSFRGPGIEKGVDIFKKLKKDGYYTTTDVHIPSHSNYLKDVIDIIQIPAFLSRQTDLILSAAKTNKIVNIKKFQLLSGKDMIRQVEKAKSVGNNKIILTERGTSIPYGNLVVDLRNIVDMVGLNYPVVMDCTHACQFLTPGQEKTSGRKDMAAIYAQAANICGANGFFAEIYPDPIKAPSDSTTSLSFDQFEELIYKIK